MEIKQIQNKKVNNIHRIFNMSDIKFDKINKTNNLLTNNINNNKIYDFYKKK